MVIHEAFGHENQEKEFYWHFHGAEEGEFGTLRIPPSDESELSYVYARNHNNKDYENKFIGNSLWNYRDGFPLKFLFMKNEDIMSYVQRQNIECEEREARKKDKRKESLEASRKEREAIIKKLTPKERKILGLPEKV